MEGRQRSVNGPHIAENMAIWTSLLVPSFFFVPALKSPNQKDSAHRRVCTCYSVLVRDKIRKREFSRSHSENLGIRDSISAIKFILLFWKTERKRARNCFFLLQYSSRTMVCSGKIYLTPC